jgi:hypothetical protein
VRAARIFAEGRGRSVDARDDAGRPDGLNGVGHTLKVTVTTQGNAASSGNKVDVDAYLALKEGPEAGTAGRSRSAGTRDPRAALPRGPVVSGRYCPSSCAAAGDAHVTSG